jgi:hypothetical protein
MNLKVADLSIEEDDVASGLAEACACGFGLWAWN